MNAQRKITFRLTALALVATTSYVLASAGCGGENNSNPMPTTQHDSGTDSTMGHPEGGGPHPEGGGPKDTGVDSPGIPDTGSCKSESSACNTCYTDAQAASDPLNACSSYAKNCVSFDPSRVPTHPTL